ncbi:MAG: hypothetical protein R3Y46_01065 [Opitutales bacterium]
MSVFIYLLGKFLALCPEFILRGICLFVVFLMKIFMPKRMRIIYSNIKKCYPTWSDKKLRAFASESSARTIEMGIFVLASPYMSEKELKKRFVLSDSLKKHLEFYAKNPRPIVLLVPHFAMMEAITMLPMLNDLETPRTGVFYRPMDSKAIDDWVLKTRSRFGVNLISRKAGLTKAFDFLKANGAIGVLFDQSPNVTGILSYFFSRPCYSSNLAGLFVEKYKSDLGFMYAKRTGFFRAEINAEIIECKKDNLSVMIAGNEKLEHFLKTDESLSADWLWLHNRWKLSQKPLALLNLKHSKTVLEETRPETDYKRQNIYINLATQESDIKQIIPLIKEIEIAREDANLSLFVEREQLDFVKSLNLGYKLIVIPRLSDGIFKYRQAIKALQNEYISLLIQFRSDSKSDSFIKKIKPLQSIAFSATKTKRKPYSNSVYIDPKLPARESYRQFLEQFGLPKVSMGA